MRIVVVLALCLLVAACASGPQNTLTQDRRDSLRIDTVEVGFPPDAKISWFDAQGDAPEDPAARLAYLEQRAIGPIKAALDAEIKPAFRGTEPAKLRVRIRYLRIPATAVRIIVGASPYSIRADLELVDAKSGQIILAASNLDAFSTSFGGVAGIVESAVADEPIIRVSKTFARVLSTWLKTGVAHSTG
jgi:hypothetical protein